jgi:hypothetical protein
MNVMPRRRSDPRSIDIRALGRLGADLYRDHCTEPDQENKTEPEDVPHDASRRHHADRNHFTYDDRVRAIQGVISSGRSHRLS